MHRHNHANSNTHSSPWQRCEHSCFWPCSIVSFMTLALWPWACKGDCSTSFCDWSSWQCCCWQDPTRQPQPSCQIWHHFTQLHCCYHCNWQKYHCYNHCCCYSWWKIVRPTATRGECLICFVWSTGNRCSILDIVKYSPKRFQLFSKMIRMPFSVGCQGTKSIL